MSQTRSITISKKCHPALKNSFHMGKESLKNCNTSGIFPHQYYCHNFNVTMWIYSTPTLFSMRGSPFLLSFDPTLLLFSFSEWNGFREGHNTSVQLPQRLNTPSSDVLLLEKNHIFYLIPNLHTFTLTGISSTRCVSHTRSFRDQIWFKIQSENIHKNLLKQNWQENAFFFNH